MSEKNIELTLNALIEDYISSLKKPVSSRERTQSVEKFKIISLFIKENNVSEYNKDKLNKQTLRFLNERNIKLVFKNTLKVVSSKSKISDFVSNHSLKNIKREITQKFKGGRKIGELIITIENELPKIIDISTADYKKLTKNKINFIRVKKILFVELIEETGILDNQDILNKLKVSKLNYDDLAILFDFFDYHLKDTEIKPFNFLLSIIDNKDDRIKLRKII